MNKRDLTTGKELKVITVLAIPLVGSSLLQFFYSIINMIFVGGLGSDAIAAVGSASFFINLGNAIQAMIVVGGGIKIAHAIGEKKQHELASYIGNSILLNAFLGIITVIALLMFGQQFINFLDLQNKVVHDMAYKYLAISGFMLFFSYFNMFFTRMLSSFGNSKQSFYISAFGLILNILLDPLFIYTFKWGVEGAAIATLVSQIIMFLAFVYLARDVLWNMHNWSIHWQSIKEILILGFPMSTQRVLFTGISIILAKLIATYGTDAVAAQKIGLQVESITYIVMGSLNGAVSSFIGQNFGAQKFKRILTGYRVTMFLGILYSFVTSVIFIAFPEQLVKLFATDHETVEMASSYLVIIGLSQIFMAMEMISTGIYTGIGLPKIPAFISIVFTMIRIPLAYTLTPIMGLDGVWWSIAISSVIKGVVSVAIFQLVYKRRYKHAT